MEQKIRFHIDGMTCQACATRIEKVLSRHAAVAAADVNFAGEEAQVRFDETQLSAAAVTDLIAKAGFHAVLINDDDVPQQTDAPHVPLQLWLLWFIALPFIAGMAGMVLGHHDWMLPPVWQFVLASIAQLFLAVPFYKGAWASLRGGLANMDVLVSLGTLSIWLYSGWMLWRHGGNHAAAHIYFEASVMVLAFVSLGKFLEERTKKQSLNSMHLLWQLTPKQVMKQGSSGWQAVDIAQVVPGDVLRVCRGERAAADGVVLSGEAWFDESHLTGESKPLLKHTGDTILAGAMNSSGSLVYQAQALGSKTRLGDMMRALAEAQGSKAPIARVADQAAAVFVPAVTLMALVTFALNFWFSGSLDTAITRAVAVLVIACPCALGLATPAAIMVGMGKAARCGIWFKDAASLERTSRVDTVVLDKTGTLTQGQPSVASVWQIPGSHLSEADLWRVTSAVEAQANHPLARAITAAAQNYGITDPPPAINVHYEIGVGMRAEVAGFGEVKIGKADYCGLRPDFYHKLPENDAAKQHNNLWATASIVAVAVNGQAIGAFALADALKPDSAAAVRRLQAQGIDVCIMSGDNDGVVRHIASLTGIIHYHAHMSPRAKAEAIRGLMQQGRVVAMVGDGINDTPALAAADVGFAMADGADAATHAAAATLMQHSVNQVADALLLARATMRNIRQNLFFAFFYNILGIPLAALGLLNPVIAGAAMAASSISVLGNALRLKKQKLN